MTDDEKNDTLCIFITPSKRVKVQNGDVEYFKRNSENYFKKFINSGVLELEYAAELMNKYGIDAVTDNDVKNVQVIFDIHGDKEGLSISEEEMHKILEPILASLGDKKIEIIMANCQGSLKFKKNNGHESLSECLKDMAEKHYVKPENISLYCMPEGHNASITFTKNGDIFFVSNNAEEVHSQEEPNDVLTARFYKNQNDQKAGLEAVHEGDCWHIPTKNGKTNILEGIYKDRPPIKIDISTGKQFSTALVHKPTDVVLYKEPLALKIKHELDLNLNKKNEINTTTKK